MDLEAVGGKPILEEEVPNEPAAHWRASGRDLGTTTSGTFSPTLKVGIALALLDAQAAPAVGSEVEVDVRGRALRCEVVAPPFVVAKTR